MSSEVFVTGVGMVSPAGCAAEQTWRGLLAGGRFVQPLSGADLAGCGVRFGGQIRDFTPPRGTEDWDRLCQLAAAAGDEAAAAAVHISAVSFGTSKGGIASFGIISETLRQRCSVSPHWLHGKMIDARPDAPAVRLAGRLPGVSTAHASVAACATGTMAVIRGVQLIQDGDAEVVLCGGADASLHRLWYAAFERMGVLAAAHPELGPAAACRPFDRSRGGFAVGEGAAALVLQSELAVKKSGATPLARIAGYARGTDPTGLTSLSSDPESLTATIGLACRRAGVHAAELACIYAHGTGTPANDRVEALAIRAALGPAVGKVPVVSFKGSIGHLLGAAGAVEIALAVLATARRESPGNATLLEPDPEFGVLNLPRQRFALRAGPILKTSLGFGGHLAVVVIAAA